MPDTANAFLSDQEFEQLTSGTAASDATAGNAFLSDAEFDQLTRPDLGDVPNFTPENAQDNLIRTAGGFFTELEEDAAATSDNPEEWKKRYALSFHMSKELRIPAEEIGSSFDEYHKLFFEHDDINKSYNSTLEMLNLPGIAREQEIIPFEEVKKTFARGVGSMELNPFRVLQQ